MSVSIKGWPNQSAAFTTLKESSGSELFLKRSCVKSLDLIWELLEGARIFRSGVLWSFWGSFFFLFCFQAICWVTLPNDPVVMYFSFLASWQRPESNELAQIRDRNLQSKSFFFFFKDDHLRHLLQSQRASVLALLQRLWVNVLPKDWCWG